MTDIYRGYTLTDLPNGKVRITKGGVEVGVKDNEEQAMKLVDQLRKKEIDRMK